MRHSSNWAVWPAIVSAVLALASGADSMLAQGGLEEGQWREYAGDTRGLKYSPLDRINKDNVKDLEVAWRWASADRDYQIANPTMRSTRNEDTPLMVNGTLYTVTPLGMVAALDPATGQQRWLYDPESLQGREAGQRRVHPPRPGVLDRRQGRAPAARHERRVPLSQSTPGPASPIRRSGRGGRVDLTEVIPRAVRSTNFMGRRPLIAGNVVVVGNAILDPTPHEGDAARLRAGVRRAHRQAALDLSHRAEAGRIRLRHVAERLGRVFRATRMSGPGWPTIPSSTTSTCRCRRRPTTTTAAIARATTCSPRALVCVEAKTGKRVWHFQVDHHGLWDYDLPAHPILGDITVNGRRIKAVIQVSKQGFTFAFDRKTGQPVWPIEERPVPQSTVPGERTSPTQPFPTKPPRLHAAGQRPRRTSIDFTPELKTARARAVEAVRPWSDLHAAVAEGHAVPARRVRRRELGRRRIRSRNRHPLRAVADVPGSATARGPGGTGFGTEGGGARRRRGGRLDSIADHRGAFDFQASVLESHRDRHEPRRNPLGHADRQRPDEPSAAEGPEASPARRSHSAPGGLATKTLVFVNAQRLESLGRYTPPPWKEWGDPDMDRKLLYVFDKQSGALLREIQLDGLSAAIPMTYMFGGKQYIASPPAAARSPRLSR